MSLLITAVVPLDLLSRLSSKFLVSVNMSLYPFNSPRSSFSIPFNLYSLCFDIVTFSNYYIILSLSHVLIFVFKSTSLSVGSTQFTLYLL